MTTASPPERAWPLSAAASAVLLEPQRTTTQKVVTLALKELVGRGAWRARTETSRSRLGRSRTTVTLRPGPRPEHPLPAPLDLLEAGIRPVRLSRGGELTMAAVGTGMRDAHGREWGQAVLDVTRGTLVREGLLERRSRRLRADAWTRTPAGELWAEQVTARCAALQDDLPGLVAADQASAVELLARAGWLLLLVPDAAQHLPALRAWEEEQAPEDRERRRSSDGLAYASGYTVWAIPDAVSGFDGAFDAGLSSAFDGAFASGDLGSGFESAGGFFDGGGGGGGGDGGGGGSG